MLPEPTLPPSFAKLLAGLSPCFTTPTFRTFCGLACGMLAGTGRRTVCGMLVGAGLSRTWRHHRAHRFFSRAAWSPDEVGLTLARLVVRLLVPEGQPVTVAVDDTLYRRSGRSVFAVGWFHDGSAKSKEKVGFGNNWVIAGIVLTIPVLGRVVCLPVLARLVRKGDGDAASRLKLARQMMGEIAENLPGRTVHGVGDAAYAGKELCKLPANVTWTTRVRKDADLHRPAPPRTGRRGRPRLKGDKLPKLEQIAAGLAFTPATVTRYGKTETVFLASFTCLWPGVFRYEPVTVVLVRNKPGIPRGGYYDIALATTDTAATPAQVVERYACRWSIEVAIEDSKQVFRVGQARNRVERAVERTVPFGLFCQTLATVWYAVAGHDPADVAAHRERAPWYTTKRHPSTADLAGKLRYTLIAARFSAGRPEQPTPAEIHAIQLAWAADDCVAA
jgi:hypothetical protein